MQNCHRICQQFLKVLEIIENMGDIKKINIKSTVTVNNISESCRACLKLSEPNKLHNIYNEQGSSEEYRLLFPCLHDFFLSLLDIKHEDGFSQGICNDCFDLLTSFHKFLVRCEKSRDILKKYFKKPAINDNIVEHADVINPDIRAEQPTEEPKLNFNDFDSVKVEYEELYQIHEFIEFGNFKQQDDDNKLPGVVNEADDFKEVETLHESAVVQNFEFGSQDESMQNNSLAGMEDSINEEYFFDNIIKSECDSEGKCGESVQDWSNDEELMGSASVDGGFECDICHRRYKARHTFLHHIQSHSNIKEEIVATINDDDDDGESVTENDLILNKPTEGGNHSCTHCNAEFLYLYELNDHIEISHPKDRPFNCKICSKSFTTINSFNTHLQTHRNESYKCDKCEQTFRSKNYLRVHNKVVHTISNHTCPHCSAEFTSKSRYEYHLKTHDPNKKFACSYCDKSFLQRHHLSNHERTHTGEEPFLCNTCGKSFKVQDALTTHLRTHTGDRPFVCKICEKSFSQRTSYNHHLVQHSGAKPHTCDKCGKSFALKVYLKTHMRKHTGERPYRCDMCEDVTFVQAISLRLHMFKVHNGKSIDDRKPFTCEFCAREFFAISAFNMHMKSHTDEKRTHFCSYCGNAFKRPEHLKTHINTVHLKQRAFQCDKCKKRFQQAGALKEHMLSHGPKEHICKFCSKSFTLSRQLRKHIGMRHEKNSFYSCFICNVEFMSSEDLEEHSNTEHMLQPLSSDSYNVEILEETFAIPGIIN